MSDCDVLCSGDDPCKKLIMITSQSGSFWPNTWKAVLCHAFNCWVKEGAEVLSTSR